MQLKVLVGAPGSPAPDDGFEVVGSLALARAALSDFIKTTREANSLEGGDVSGYATALQNARKAQVGDRILFGGLRHEIASI
jgi:hypothetical protein